MSAEWIVTSAPTTDDPMLGQMLASWVGERPIVYVDDGMAPLTAEIPGWLETRATLRETGDPAGIKPASFRWNARKFAVKPFVWLDAARAMGAGILTWLDADVRMVKPFRAGFLSSLLAGVDVAYLGRGAMHPETGYVGFRIPEALPVLEWCCAAYRSGRYRRIRDGWTDCHVLRAALAAHPDVRTRDLTGHRAERWRSTVDAMALSPLGPYVMHLKGKQRKREALAG